MFPGANTRGWLVLLAGLTLVAEPVSAQRRAAPGPRDGGHGFFAVGVQRADIDRLNNALFASGLPAFSQTFLTLGGGGFAVRNRFLIGGEGHGLIQSSETTADGVFRTGVTAGFGLFDLGYQVWRSGRFAVYPMVGIGGGGISLRIRERATVDFDDLLDDPRRGVTVTGAGMLLSASLGADLLIPVGPARRGGFLVGVQGGYTFFPLEAAWFADGSDVAGGPDVRLTGPWLRVTVGGGRR